MKNFILVVFIALLCSCNTQNKKTEKQAAPNPIAATPAHNHVHENGVCPDDYKSLEKMSVDELLEVNRNITARVRTDYRSWNYTEPDRWPSLADNFADGVIGSCPEASPKKKEIAQVYLNHLRKRAEIYSSDSKNKQAQMGQSGTEFIYNLRFLVGVEGYQKWELDSKKQLVRFNQMRDSLNAIIAFSDKKYQELKKQQKP